MSLQLSAPQPLAATHLLDEFACGEASLDNWLKRRALSNQLSEASRTFVVTDQEGRVFGYYAMAAGAVSHQMATSGVRRNIPDPIPVMVLARLAIDRHASASSSAQPCFRTQSTGLRPCHRTRVYGPCSFMRCTIGPSSFTSTTAFRNRHSTR